MKIIRTAALLTAGILVAGCGQNPSAPAAPAAASEAAAPVLDGPCPPDRVGSRTVSNDPVLLCTDTSTGPRWILSTAEPIKVELVTTTTACQASAIAATLQAAQAEVDSLVGGRRQAQSAVAQIQLIVDNTGRQVDIAQRYLTQVQGDYDQAKKTYEVLRVARYRDSFVAAERRLADAKDVVASWRALRTKALGDLSLGKATLGDWDKRIAEAQQAVAAAKATQATLTCS